MHSAEVLEIAFAEAFFSAYKTRLCGGAREPLYLPYPSDIACPISGNDLEYATIYYREDFFSSALHEVAHWCIAGSARRCQPDFGYWYIPDGRSTDQQQQFLIVETKPQAIEWLFSIAATFPFQISLDNLYGEIDGDAMSMQQSRFKSQVYRQALGYLTDGLPERAAHFIECLSALYQTDNSKDYFRSQLANAIYGDVRCRDAAI